MDNCKYMRSVHLLHLSVWKGLLHDIHDLLHAPHLLSFSMLTLLHSQGKSALYHAQHSMLATVAKLWVRQEHFKLPALLFHVFRVF